MEGENNCLYTHKVLQWVTEYYGKLSCKSFWVSKSKEFMICFYRGSNLIIFYFEESTIVKTSLRL